MSKIALTPNASGTGTLTIAAPNTDTDRTLTLPDTTTTLVGTDATQTLTNKSIAASQLTGDVAAARITGALNASGSAPIYACRAWVNFNGTGTVAIRASGNVSSITDNGTGQYTINFTTAMPDAHYAVVGSSSVDSVLGRASRAVHTTGPYNTSSIKINTVSTAGNEDAEFANVAIFR